MQARSRPSRKMALLYGGCGPSLAHQVSNSPSHPFCITVSCRCLISSPNFLFCSFSAGNDCWKGSFSQSRFPATGYEHHRLVIEAKVGFAAKFRADFDILIALVRD